MLNVATELREMEKQARLTFAALNETIRMEKLLDDASFTRSLILIRLRSVAQVVVIEAVVVVMGIHHVVRVVSTITNRQSIHQAQSRRVKVETVIHVR